MTKKIKYESIIPPFIFPKISLKICKEPEESCCGKKWKIR
jgi:hypothetical protein